MGRPKKKSHGKWRKKINETSNDILKGAAEIADYSMVSQATMLRWVRQYDFPAAKIDGIWMSTKSAVDKWTNKQVESQTKRGIHCSRPLI